MYGTHFFNQLQIFMNNKLTQQPFQASRLVFAEHRLQ